MKVHTKPGDTYRSPSLTLLVGALSILTPASRIAGDTGISASSCFVSAKRCRCPADNLRAMARRWIPTAKKLSSFISEGRIGLAAKSGRILWINYHDSPSYDTPCSLPCQIRTSIRENIRLSAWAGRSIKLCTASSARETYRRARMPPLACAYYTTLMMPSSKVQENSNSKIIFD